MIYEMGAVFFLCLATAQPGEPTMISVIRGLSVAFAMLCIMKAANKSN